MTDRPILFSAPMVRALLAGTKTQTRRIVKGDDVAMHDKRITTWVQTEGWWKPRAAASALEQQFITTWPQGLRCPYGVPGDVLWVRESAWYDRSEIGILGMRCFFEGGHVRFASGATGRGPGHLDTYTAEIFALNSSLKKRPGIHMPRWASRISLRVTDVRVERLNEISEGDAAAEGLLSFPVDDEEEPNWHWEPQTDPYQGFGSAGDAYSELWEHINGAGSWAANPWVWAVSFEGIA